MEFNVNNDGSVWRLGAIRHTQNNTCRRRGQKWFNSCSKSTKQFNIKHKRHKQTHNEIRLTECSTQNQLWAFFKFVFTLNCFVDFFQCNIVNENYGL